jgi:lysophospholipase L1-like esterase
VLGALLGWVVSLALFFGFVELGLRLLPQYVARPATVITRADPECGWVKVPDTTTTRKTGEFKATYAVNSLGLRDDASLTKAKPAGTQRVLFVGDSFVQGYTVERDDLFVDLVERAFAADGRKIESVNGGTEGWSTDQEVVWLVKEGLSYSPDAVVFCFFQNDVWGDQLASYTGLPKPRFPPQGDGATWERPAGEPPERSGWLASHTCLGGFFHGFETSSKYRADLAYSNMGADEAVVLKSPPAAFADGWARTTTALRGLKAACDRADTKLLFVAIPSREQVEPGAKARWGDAHGLSDSEFDPDQPTTLVLAAATSAGIPATAQLDPRPAMKSAAESIAKSDGHLYFAKDFHVNAEGNRVLARAIFERLNRPDYFGPAASVAAGAVSPAAAAVLADVATGSVPLWPFLVGGAWLLLSTLYGLSYRDESFASAFVKVALMIGAVVAIVFVFGQLVGWLGPVWGKYVGIAVVVGVLGYLLFKMSAKLGIMKEVYGSFVRRGDWYMLPLLVAMLSIGGLLVVASSSPFLAPFIYTLF